VLLLSLGSVDEAMRSAAAESLSTNYRVTIESAEIDLPAECYYKPRDRYRADKILDYLDREYARYDRVIALTAVDISVTVDQHEDWGVFGFGRRPGRCAVVSSHRLAPSNPDAELLKERIYKVVLHEYGHTTGLPHCKASDQCPMQDANGKIATVDKSKSSLCEECLGDANEFVQRGGNS
jgi:archaemetzincin